MIGNNAQITANGVAQLNGQIATLQANLQQTQQAQSGQQAPSTKYSTVVGSGNGFVLKASSECKGQYTVANGREALNDATNAKQGLLYDVQIGGAPVGSIIYQTKDQNSAQPLASGGYSLAFTDKQGGVTEYKFIDLSTVDAPSCTLSVSQIPQ